MSNYLCHNLSHFGAIGRFSQLFTLRPVGQISGVELMRMLILTAVCFIEASVNLTAPPSGRRVLFVLS